MSARRLLAPALVAAALPASAMAADLGLPAPYLCGDTTVSLAAGPDEARLRLGGRWMTFLPAEAASGAKYAAEGAADQWVWGKGQDLMVSLPGMGEVACTPAGPAAESLSAGGNEPGWRLNLADGKAELLLMDRSVTAAEHAAPEAIPGGRRITFGDSTVDIADAICRDDATGLPHPYSVTVAGPDQTLQGCGGAPGDLLGAVTWAITSAGGAAVPDPVVANIRFEADGRFNGASGCNRMVGSYELTGEGLKIGPAATTRMACPEAQMQTERAVTEALTKVTRFDFADDGRLILMAGDTPVLEAAP